MHPELDAKFPGLLLEEYISDPVASVETELLDPNTISAAATSNSGIENSTGVYDDIYSPKPIFTINPIQPPPEAEPEPTPEAKPDDQNVEDYDGDNNKVEELEPPEEDIPYPILIERDDYYSNDQELIADE